MAMDYEVRPEYEELPLSELLDSPVMCFQGVGDTQNDILQRFFGVNTVRDLANLPYFIWSLGIQELALAEEGNGGTPVGDVAKEHELKFTVRPEYTTKNARELLDSPVRALEGLTPSEALALYDGFRITNVTQFVQNRIMLEARIIEYLQKVESGEISEADTDAEIASILLSGTDVPGADAARRALSGDGEVGRMASDLAVHLRTRLDEMRGRAREKAGEIASRPGSSSEELAEEASRVRPDKQRDSRSRLDAIRESRLRSDTDAVRGTRTSDQVTSAVSSRQALMSRMRGEPESGSSGYVRPNVPPAAKVAAQEAVQAEAAAEAAATAAEAAEQKRRPAARPNLVPWIAAAAVAILVVGGVWIWLTSTEPPISSTAQLEGDAAQSGAEDQSATGTAPGVAGQPGVGAQSEAGAQTGAATGTGVGTQAAEPEQPPALPVRSVHRVRSGQSLWRISRGYYKDPELWPWIYRENRELIDDPDLIYPNQRVKIPEIP